MKMSEEIYTHKLLWRAAKASKRCESSERDRLYLDLSALMMAYFAFEGFVNFLGEIMCPELWVNEKQAFKGQGDTLEAKIGAIANKCDKFEWKKGERPYQDVKKLKKFRDSLAHAKVERTEYSTLEKEDGSHIKWSHTWDEFVKPSEVEKSMDSIKAFCQSLLVEARKHSDDECLVPDAFSGLLAWADEVS